VRTSTQFQNKMPELDCSENILHKTAMREIVCKHL